jgi:ribosomal protein S6--L-glutamate ligase
MVLQALARSMPVVNPIDALLLTENKFLSNLVFEQAGLRVPPAILISRQTEELINALESWGELVIKPIFTYGGHGSVRVETREQLTDIIERLSGFEDRFYAEKFIPNEHWDCRIDLVDGEIVSCYGRRARPGSWKSNIGSGGQTFKIEPTSEIKEMAVQAFHASGLVLGGVDIIESKSGELYLLEINGVSRMGDLDDEREGICDNEPKIEAIADYIEKTLGRED